MGWKSTKTLKQQKAIDVILEWTEKLSNEQLGNAMFGMFGDDPELPYYGYNFTVVDDSEEIEEYEYYI